MRSPRLVALAGAALFVAGAAAAASPATASGSRLVWTGGAPLPAAPHLGLPRNEDGEPGMGVTPDGQFWIASDVAPYAADDPRAKDGLLSGADIWTSTDGGRSYRWVADPFRTGEDNPGLAGEDTDLTVAPEKNASGHYNVYATSLWLGASSLAWSTDGGRTWTTNPLGGVPAQDRPWLSATGPCRFQLVYHQLPSFTPVLNTYDVCSVPVPITTGTVLDPVSSTNFTLSTFPGLTNAFGKQVADNSPGSPHKGNIYIPMTACTVKDPTDLLANAESTSGCATRLDQELGVSTDGGMTFHDYHVATSPNSEVEVWPNTVATDADGTVYFAWFDNHNAYLNTSRDGGKTWSAPKLVNGAPSRTAVYPTVSALGHGHVGIAWYGTTRAGNANDAKVMGPASKPGSAPWYVFYAESFDAGRTFGAPQQSTGVIHRGELCTKGGACSHENSRNLLDDFGVALSPVTGLPSITYTSDRPDGEQSHAFTGYTSLARTSG